MKYLKNQKARQSFPQMERYGPRKITKANKMELLSQVVVAFVMRARDGQRRGENLLLNFPHKNRNLTCELCSQEPKTTLDRRTPIDIHPRLHVLNSRLSRKTSSPTFVSLRTATSHRSSLPHIRTGFFICVRAICVSGLVLMLATSSLSHSTTRSLQKSHDDAALCNFLPQAHRGPDVE